MQSNPQLESLTNLDYKQIKQNFTEELIKAQRGKDSSLVFIKHLLPNKPLINSGIVQGIVIGGTNYILSTEEIQLDGTRKILDRRTGILPVITDHKVFFDFLGQHLDSRATAIGFNFGFPLAPTSGNVGQLDGTLLYADKEHLMKGLIGKTIGKETSQLFKSKFGRDIPVAVANDTVCLTLSGDGTENASMIAGTGFNIGIKLEEDQIPIVVNFEAGNFNKFELSNVLKTIDERSGNPGVHIFEKAVAGKYLALYFNEKAKELRLSIKPLQTSQELSELSHENHTDPAGDLARAILERSAFLVASAVAGVYEFLNRPAKLTIIGEGSMLWDGWQYPENLEKQLERLGIPNNAVQIKHIQDSSIKGAIGLLTR